MKKIILILTGFILINISACKDNIVGSLSDGTYSYKAYDSLGTIVTEGELCLKFIDSTGVKGNWEIEKIGDPQNIGPQTGEGNLEGEIIEGQIIIGLNPDIVDYNVFLEGKAENNRITGKWFFSSYTGLTNWGRFEAVK